MAQFMVEFPHTKEQCAHELDELQSQSPQLLQNAAWGCAAGMHTGWAMVDANSQSDVMNMIPDDMRKDVQITQVNRFTPEQIRRMHA